jgi:hypothetical protein
MSKSIQVTTNDSANASFKLVIKGSVKKTADIQPDYIRMSGRLGTKIDKTVTITPNAEYPFKIKKVKTREKGNIRFVYKPGGKGYELTAINIYDKEGSYDDELIIVTDNPKLPELRIPVNAYILSPAPDGK